MKHLHEVHAVELVTREDQEVRGGLVREVNEVLPHGIRGALVPVIRFQGLLGGEDLHEALAECIETVGVVDVPVQRGGIELGKDIDLAQAGMDAVGDGDVDQPELPAEGHGRLCTLSSEGYSLWPLPPPSIMETIFFHTAPAKTV